ncbi:hypothetical protein D3OALGA1CA_2546 [Olavius algarvensis associated proteobacterium Delta 3]|nr:hypothetical protein D3OALGA1CA_2546 [Olavius algarvensis associated proteobacterium Delta 3]CAB5146644.1 hypothetical protein D3OALGB2SA_4549 [Olavius algarvensis associated proteobacterium Delta 3]
MLLPKVHIKKILYATDLSENALHAAAYAVSLANLYDAGLTILNVVEDSPLLDEKIIGYVSAEKWEAIKKRNEEDARQTIISKAGGKAAIGDALENFCKTVQEDMVDCTFRTDDILVLRGNPVEEILKQSEENNCDIIVMGTHGTGSFADAMIGSTARRVVRRSQKPVFVVRLPED